MLLQTCDTTQAGTTVASNVCVCVCVGRCLLIPVGWHLFKMRLKADNIHDSITQSDMQRSHPLTVTNDSFYTAAS